MSPRDNNGAVSCLAWACCPHKQGNDRRIGFGWPALTMRGVGESTITFDFFRVLNWRSLRRVANNRPSVQPALYGALAVRPIVHNTTPQDPQCAFQALNETTTSQRHGCVAREDAAVAVPRQAALPGRPLPCVLLVALAMSFGSSSGTKSGCFAMMLSRTAMCLATATSATLRGLPFARRRW